MIGTAEVERFRRAVDDVRSVVLVSHINPDGDAIGSELGLARFLASRGKTVHTANQDPAPESLDFLDLDGFVLEIYEPARHDPLLRTIDRVVLVDNSAPDRLGRMERPMLDAAGRSLCIDHHPKRDAPWGASIATSGRRVCCSRASLRGRYKRPLTRRFFRRFSIDICRWDDGKKESRSIETLE